jgi:aminomethyltransferase
MSENVNQPLKTTPLYSKHQELNARMLPFGGFDMPIEYQGITAEHDAVRNDVGMFDVSHMGEVLIQGENALQYLERICTNEMTSLEVGQIRYSFLCYENGTVVDDILVYRFSDIMYCLVINASNIEKDIDWLTKHLIDGVDLENVSPKTAEIALQGPAAERILQGFTDVDLSTLPFFRFVWADVAGCHTLISRTGYTGEDGFELYTDNDSILILWDTLLAAGVAPIGLGARDTLRFEASLPLYGHEISDSITPVEAGFSRFIDFDKEFIGKAALQQEKQRKLIGLDIIDRGIARADYLVYQNDKVIGFITTGYKIKEKTYALALVDAATPLGIEVSVDVRGKHIRAVTRNKKFMVKSYKK